MKRASFGILLLASLWLAGSSASLTVHPEGVLVSFRESFEYGWSPSAGEYLLVVRAGETGAELDLTRMPVDASPGPVQTLRAHGGVTSRVTFDGTQTGSMKVNVGSGRAFLVRDDLATWPVGVPDAPRRVEGSLGSGQCRGYFVDTVFLYGSIAVTGEGPGAQFRLWDMSLTMFHESDDHLNTSYSAEEFRYSQVVVQACARTPTSYAIETRNVPDEDEEPSRNRAHQITVVSLAVGIPTLLFAVGVAGYRARRRRRQP